MGDRTFLKTSRTKPFPHMGHFRQHVCVCVCVCVFGATINRGEGARGVGEGGDIFCTCFAPAKVLPT